SRRKILSFILTLITVALAMIFISYQVVNKFACNADNVYYGKSQAAVAAEIREEIQERPDCEPISFKNSDNQTLRGFLFKRPLAIGTLLLCHGYKGSKEFMYGFLDMFPDFNLLIFDFRASGESDGQYISMGYHEYKDVYAACKFLKANTPQDLPFIILGFSMGGGATLRAASQYPGLAQAFIIDSTFSDLRSMFLQGYSKRVSLPYYPFFPLTEAMFRYVANCNVNEVNSVAATRMINEPILFIHSCSDEFITPDHSIKLYANALNQASKIWIGPHARHGLLHAHHPEIYGKKVRKFLHKAIGLSVQTISSGH
ncbi:alpha/beta fold hydrolase, partial [Candidatus Dependentiae bacterium]|nr:alpha/beta fold hydrolase [Candidatus Dependentiae bacterium]